MRDKELEVYGGSCVFGGGIDSIIAEDLWGKKKKKDRKEKTSGGVITKTPQQVTDGSRSGDKPFRCASPLKKV